MDGSNKPKLSLGDDPDRTGVYTLEFNITNLSGEALSYDLDPVVFTETMSSDGRTVAELAYLLDAEYNYSVTPASNSIASLSGNHLSLGGYSSAKITVTLTLTDASKDYINANFVNGMYVEGYVRLVSRNADGIGLNLPYLAFFGDWSDAPMLDVTAYEVGASQEDSSVLEEDKLIADVYATLPMAGFASQDNNGNPTTGAWGMGAYAYILPQGYSTPATVERHASLTSSEDGAYMLYSISAGLLRGAKRVEMQIADSVTGEVIWTKTGYNGRKSHSSGGEQSGGYIQVEFDVRELGLANNSVYTSRWNVSSTGATAIRATATPSRLTLPLTTKSLRCSIPMSRTRTAARRSSSTFTTITICRVSPFTPIRRRMRAATRSILRRSRTACCPSTTGNSIRPRALR